MKKILIFTMFILIVGYTNKVDKLNLQDKNSEYYYCAYLADAVDFQIYNKINSMNEFNQYMTGLTKREGNFDANYYKIIKQNSETILYGYSMKTRELRELIKLDNKTKRLLSRKTFEPYGDKECHWNYKNINNEKLIATEVCNDKSKTIMHLKYSQRDKRYITREYLIYKNNKLIDKIIYDENGIPINDEGAEGGAYDICIPYIAYRIKINRAIGRK